MTNIKNIINRVVFVLDSSGSMKILEDKVIKVFDSQIEYLVERSTSLDQETRISVYGFSDKVYNIIFDKDVLRLPSIKDHYRASGQTALIDATLTVIKDMKEIPEKYSDVSVLIYIITDGANNINNQLSALLSNTIRDLPDNYTIAVLAPTQTGVHEAKKFGFPAQNIQVWDATSSKGLEMAGEMIKSATNSYMQARSSGLRSTKNLFNINLSSLNTRAVSNTLDELKPSEYEILPVRQDSRIDDFCKSWLGEYRTGSAYYQLSKKEIIQPKKAICILHNKNGKVYTGANARKIIGLPDYEIKVDVDTYGDYTVFIQSNAQNRNLVKGTQLIVLK